MRWTRTFPLWLSRPRFFLSAQLMHAADRFCRRLPLRADQHDGRFFFAVGGVLGFTLLSYWSLTAYWDVRWFAGEDGVSEWWAVATYLASAAMAALAARLLTRLGHPRLGLVHLLFAAALVVGALEEMSWGQRLFGWSTPQVLARVNEQGETTIHNLVEFDRVFNTGIFWASTLALVGAGVRVFLHRHHRVTTADFLLPSLVLSPALLLIAVWYAGGQSFRTLMAYFDLRPVGGEIPEVLLGLCLCLYTGANLVKARALRRYASTDLAARLR